MSAKPREAKRRRLANGAGRGTGDGASRMKVLWPQHYWGVDQTPELEGLGSGIDAEFVTRFSEVTADQWRTCDALVGPAPPLEVLAKLERCRIYVKPAVGFDD